MRGGWADRQETFCSRIVGGNERRSLPDVEWPFKHPVMAGRESSVRLALESPDEVRQSRIDSEVSLFYKAEGTRRWVCAVAKQARDPAFLVTAYPTDAIKEGIRIWPN
jgi:hypothetical protein